MNPHVQKKKKVLTSGLLAKPKPLGKYQFIPAANVHPFTFDPKVGYTRGTIEKVLSMLYSHEKPDRWRGVHEIETTKFPIDEIFPDTKDRRRIEDVMDNARKWHKKEIEKQKV